MCKYKQLKCKMCKEIIFAIFTYFNAYFYEIHVIILLESSGYMVLYLVSNNLVLDNIKYESFENVEEKRVSRPLSIEGEKAAVKLIKKIDADVIYSSNYSSALATAKYFSSYKNLTININSFLNDSKIGKLENRNIKMLRFMQERNYDFKFKDGESINETQNRMELVINKIIKNNYNKNIVVFTHKRAILCYLTKYLNSGYNLDDRLILTFNDNVIIDDLENDVDIIKLDIIKGKIKNVVML